MTTPIGEDVEVRSAIELLEAWIEAQRVYRELPGLSIGIVHDQSLLWARGFGWADVIRREAATADTLYRIGSITARAVRRELHRADRELGGPVRDASAGVRGHHAHADGEDAV